MRLLFASAAVLCFVACGSSDSTGAGGGSSGGPGDDTSDDGGSTVGDSGNPDPTPGCGPAVAKKGYVGSQTLSGRTYGLYVPDKYDGKTSYPIVIVLHGDGGTGDEIRNYVGTKLETESGGGALFAYPDGEGTTWQTDDITNM